MTDLPYERVYVTAPVGLTIGADVKRALSTHTQVKIVEHIEKAEIVLQIVHAINEKESCHFLRVDGYVNLSWVIG